MSKQITIPPPSRGTPPVRLSSFDLIRQFLSDAKGKPKKRATPAGEIERFVTSRHFSKGSTISRNLRSMEEAGELSASYFKAPNGQKCVAYILCGK